MSKAIKYIDLLLNESETSKFQIPSKLSKYYKIDDNIRNAKNWQGKVMVHNNRSDDKTKVGDYARIRYIAIDLNSNMIVPITIYDEHQTGYEMLGILKRKGLLPKGNWTIINSWGTNYIYDNEEHKDNMLKALKKYLEYGGDPKLEVEAMGGSYLGDVQDFIDRAGNIKVGKNEIAKFGREIISKFEYIAKEYKKLEGISKKHMTPRESDIVDLGEYCIAFLKEFLDFGGLIYKLNIDKGTYKDNLTEDKVKKWIDMIEKAIIKLDYFDIVWPILASDGLKNNLHQCLKIASKQKGYNRSGFDSIFGDVDTAIKEFDRLAQI